MVNHTQAFIEKHRMLLQKRENKRKEMVLYNGVFHTKEFVKKHKMLLENREQEKRLKKEAKEEKKKETYENLKKRRRERYQLNKDAHKKWREENKELLKSYSDKYKKERLERLYKEFDEIASKILVGKTFKIVPSNRENLWYYVCTDGSIFNNNGKLLGWKDKYGYIRVNNTSAHRMIWEAFNGAIQKGYEIDHINTIRDDNRLENLRIVTHKENCNNSLSIKNYTRHNRLVDRSYLKKKRHRVKKKLN